MSDLGYFFKNTTTRYPEWRSKVKTKGKRDRSLKERSKRRKPSR